MVSSGNQSWWVLEQDIEENPLEVGETPPRKLPGGAGVFASLRTRAEAEPDGVSFHGAHFRELPLSFMKQPGECQSRGLAGSRRGGTHTSTRTPRAARFKPGLCHGTLEAKRKMNKSMTIGLNR